MKTTPGGLAQDRGAELGDQLVNCGRRAVMHDFSPDANVRFWPIADVR